MKTSGFAGPLPVAAAFGLLGPLPLMGPRVATVFIRLRVSRFYVGSYVIY